MSSRRLSMAFTGGLFLLMAWALWQAYGWELQASLMAWLIGLPTAALLAVQLGREILGRPEQSAPAGGSGLLRPPQDFPPKLDRQQRRRGQADEPGHEAGLQLPAVGLPQRPRHQQEQPAGEGHGEPPGAHGAVSAARWRRRSRITGKAMLARMTHRMISTPGRARKPKS